MVIKYGNSSSEITTKTLAPPRSDNNDKENSKSFEDPANNESSQQQLEVPHTKEDDSILANSSNIAPPEELTLPVVEANDYSSFNDVTRLLMHTQALKSHYLESTKLIRNQLISYQFGINKKSRRNIKFIKFQLNRSLLVINNTKTNKNLVLLVIK